MAKFNNPVTQQMYDNSHRPEEKDLEVNCTSCGCELLIIPGTIKKGYCCFFGYEPVLIPVGSHLCDYCEDHFRRD